MELKLKPEKIETLEYLLSRVFEKDQTGKPKFCFLLGAGCSAYSGIPLGWGVIERCRTIVFLNHHLQGSKVKNMSYPGWRDFYAAAEKFRDDRKDEYEKYVAESEKKFKANFSEKEIRDIIPDELENSPEFDISVYAEKIFNDRLYGFWLDKYDEDPRERQMFIEHIIEDVEPAGDYILFTSLIDGQVIHNVFTTNFDDLLNEALVNYYNNRARVYAHNEMARYISPVSKRPNIIKLHGDYLYENIKNTNLETGDLEANMKTKFSEILNQMNLVVIGYGGSDHSVMSVLEMVKKDTKYCLIWCGIDPEKLNWRVVHLINNTKNSFFVPVSDFQTLVFKLWTHADLKLPDFESDLKVKKARVEDFLTKYKDQVKDRDEVTKKEMDILEDHLTYYNRAYKYLELKQFEKAIDDLNTALQIDPTYTNAYINRGLAFNNLKQFDKAIEDYTRAIKLDPDSVLAYGNRSLVNFDLKQYEKTIEDCNKAIELDPTYTNVYINRGLAYSNLKQYKEALNDYNKAIELNPNQALAFSNRGLLYYDELKYQQAIEDYNKAIELDPEFTNAYINRGLAYYYLNQVDKAIEDYNRAIKLNPKYALAYVNRGLANYDLIQNEKAIEDYTMAIELDPDYALAYGNRGLVFHDLMEYEKAIEDYDKALKLDPKYANAYINRGLANYNLRKYELAILDYDKAIKLNPDYSLAYNNRGLARYYLLQYEEAVRDFDKAIELDPKNTNAYINRGNNHFGLKQYEKACEDYSRTLELEPQNALALGNRGLAYNELKQYKQAIADYIKIIEIDPDYLVAYQNLAEIYLFTGQYSDVVKIVDKAMSKDIAIQDKALLTYLKLITVILAGTDNSETSKQMDQLLQEEFTSLWDLTHYEDWLKGVDMSVDIRHELQALTERMKKKITK